MKKSKLVRSITYRRTRRFDNLQLVFVGLGTVKQRLGTESQLPFGYCSLSMHPAEEAVVSPSGHIYSREYILEYLLTKSKELKKVTKAFEAQEVRCNHFHVCPLILSVNLFLQTANRKSEEQTVDDIHTKAIQNFADTQDGVSGVMKRKLNDTDNLNNYQMSRKKVIDDTESNEKLEQLRKVSPWIPQFTPQAKEAEIKEPLRRPPSPCSGRPLRSKDLIPIQLIRESGSENSSGVVRYLCPVTR
jgi:nitric oxide synthase-interacting protein